MRVPGTCRTVSFSHSSKVYYLIERLLRTVGENFDKGHDFGGLQMIFSHSRKVNYLKEILLGTVGESFDKGHVLGSKGHGCDQPVTFKGHGINECNNCKLDILCKTVTFIHHFADLTFL